MLQTSLLVARSSDIDDHLRIRIGEPVLVDHLEVPHVGPSEESPHLLQLCLNIVLLLHQPLAFGLCSLLFITHHTLNTSKPNALFQLTATHSRAQTLTLLPRSIASTLRHPSSTHKPLTTSRPSGSIGQSVLKTVLFYDIFLCVFFVCLFVCFFVPCLEHRSRLLGILAR